MPLTVGDTDPAFATLTLRGWSGNPPLLPAEYFTFGGTDASRAAAISPARGMTAVTSITIIVSDGSATTPRTFNLTVLPPHETWLQANFGAGWNNPAISGDSIDCDKDGLSDLFEYTLGSLSNDSDVAVASRVSTDSGKLEIAFTRNAAASDVTVSVMASDDLNSRWATSPAVRLARCLHRQGTRCDCQRHRRRTGQGRPGH